MTSEIVLLFGGIAIGIPIGYMFRGRISPTDKNADYVIPQLLNEDELKHELEKSLHKEDYEKAAEYRDELNQREQRKMSAK